MHKDAFNADFYVVAATIIPVLFLALTLQGTTYERMISRAIKEMGRKGRLSIRQSATLYAIGGITVVIVYAGVVGEWTAILALYNRSASHNTASTILILLFILLIAVVTGPAFRWAAPIAKAITLMRDDTDDQSARKADQPSSDDSERSSE